VIAARRERVSSAVGALGIWFHVISGTGPEDMPADATGSIRSVEWQRVFALIEQGDAGQRLAPQPTDG